MNAEFQHSWAASVYRHPGLMKSNWAFPATELTALPHAVLLKVAVMEGPSHHHCVMTCIPDRATEMDRIPETIGGQAQQFLALSHNPSQALCHAIPTLLEGKPLPHPGPSLVVVTTQLSAQWRKSNLFLQDHKLLFSGFHFSHYNTCEIGFLFCSFPLRNDGIENLLRCLLAIIVSSLENFLLIFCCDNVWILYEFWTLNLYNICK